MGNVMAPVPYDVPRLPKDLQGVAAAGEALAQFYRECGVDGGGGGELFGLRIDHILHAIVGTPTFNGELAPSRTDATLGEPLMALCEVAYTDVLLELFSETVVLKPQWNFVDEKVGGVVEQVALHRAHYAVCEPIVKQVLFVLIEIWETLRQCQVDEALVFHLQHQNYARAVKKRLAVELTARLKSLSWQLSTQLLHLQIEVRRATRAGGQIESVARGSEPTPTGGGDLLEQLLAPKKSSKLFKSFKRAVTTQKMLSKAYGRAHEKSVSKAIEEMSRAADERAAAEAEARAVEERAAEERASIQLESVQRGRSARKHVLIKRKDRNAAEEAAQRAKAYALAQKAAEDAAWEQERHDAASKMQRRQRGILARQRIVEIREERDEEEERKEKTRRRMKKMRFAIRAQAAAIKVTLQMAEEAAARRAKLAEGAAFRVTEARLDVLELLDNGPRQEAWSALKESVALSDMLPVALGTKVRPRTLYLKQDLSDATGLITDTPTSKPMARPAWSPSKADTARRDATRQMHPSRIPEALWAMTAVWAPSEYVQHQPTPPTVGMPPTSLSARARHAGKVAPWHAPPVRPGSARATATVEPQRSARSSQLVSLRPLSASGPARRQPQPLTPLTAPVMSAATRPAMRSPSPRGETSSFFLTGT